jgi:hypothetical protein
VRVVGFFMARTSLAFSLADDAVLAGDALAHRVRPSADTGDRTGRNPAALERVDVDGGDGHARAGTNSMPCSARLAGRQNIVLTECRTVQPDADEPEIFRARRGVVPQAMPPGTSRQMRAPASLKRHTLSRPVGPLTSSKQAGSKERLLLGPVPWSKTSARAVS